MSQDNKEYSAYLWTAFKRYNSVPSKVTRLEYGFVFRIVESEFYFQRVKA